MTDTLDIDAIRERHRSLNDEALRRIAASDDAAWNPQVRALAREELAARGIAAPSPVVAPKTATTPAAPARTAPTGLEGAKWAAYAGIIVLFFSLLMLGNVMGWWTATKMERFFDCLWSFHPACQVSYTRATALTHESGRLFSIGGLAYAIHLFIGLGFRLSLRGLMAWWLALIALCVVNLVALLT